MHRHPGEGRGPGFWIPASAGMTALFFLHSIVHAAAGKTGAIILQEPFGARPFAMGQAYAALGDDIFAMQFNPASLSRLRDSQAAAQFSQALLDTQLGFMALATPLSPNQALGLSVAYLDAGKTDILDATGAATRSVTAERDLLAQAGYSYALAMPTGRLHLGVGGKFMQSTIFDEGRAAAYAADLGTVYTVPWKSGTASVALAAANLGPGIRYSGGLASGSASDPLPATIRAGAGYAWDVFNADTISAGLQVDRILYDNSNYESVGLEYNYHQLCSLRFGYRAGQDLGTFTFGLGLNYRGVSFDYAIGMIQTFNSLQQFSLNYRFNIPGIRYTEAAPPSPLETLVDKAKRAIASRRFFDAKAETEKIQTFFPETGQAAALNQEIERQVDRMMITSPDVSPNTLDARIPVGGSAEYSYASGFRKYFASQWQEAVVSLQRTRQLEPENREVEQYLAKAKSKSKEVSERVDLQKKARIGTLFELANQAFEAGDFTRSTRILDEILRTGPYQPAESLLRRIQEAKRKPRAAAPPPAPKPVLAPAEKSAPSESDVARADELFVDAMRAYSEGQTDRALSRARAARQLDPNNTLIRNFVESLEREAKQRP